MYCEESTERDCQSRQTNWRPSIFFATGSSCRLWSIILCSIAMTQSIPEKSVAMDVPGKPANRVLFAPGFNDSDWLDDNDLSTPRFCPLPPVVADAALIRPAQLLRDKTPSPAYLKLVDDSPTPSEPDISTPGPDFGDYPNSAFTLPKGRAYVEIAPLGYQAKDKNNSASNSAAYLLRYGVTDNVELRLGGAGLTTVFDPGNTFTGFSPLIVDTKIHLWNDKMEKFIPAASFEAYIQTNLGSPEFQGGVQPSLNLNLDFPFTKKTNVEMTFGYTGVREALNNNTGQVFIPRNNHLIAFDHQLGLNVYQFAYQWAIEQQVTDRFQVFLHGYYNGAVFLQNGVGKVVGAGYFYQISKRATFYNSYNAGLDSFSPPFTTQMGFAFAF